MTIIKHGFYTGDSCFSLPTEDELAQIKETLKSAESYYQKYNLERSLEGETAEDFLNRYRELIEQRIFDTKIENSLATLNNNTRAFIPKLKSSSTENEATIRELNTTIESLNKEISLNHLLFQVNSTAKQRLKRDNKFYELFETIKGCNSFVVSMDIRRSTELMLKSKSPQDFECFITSLCEGLATIVKDNYGVFDKFTGDGVLAFFPDFFSGDDAGYFAAKTAIACHSFFNEFYHSNRHLFNIILNDTGLGIGIDYGRTHLSKISTYTVIGHPVVYACRFSSANHKTTLANHPCYEILNQKYAGKISFSETIVSCKNEGNVVAYEIEGIDSNFTAQAPDWDVLTEKYLNPSPSANPND